MLQGERVAVADKKRQGVSTILVYLVLHHLNIFLVTCLFRFSFFVVLLFVEQQGIKSMQRVKEDVSIK